MQHSRATGGAGVGEDHHTRILEDPGYILFGDVAGEAKSGQINVGEAHTLKVSRCVGAIGAGNDQLKVTACFAQQPKCIHQRFDLFVRTKLAKGHDLERAGWWIERRGRSLIEGTVRGEQHILRAVLMLKNLHVARDRHG